MTQYNVCPGCGKVELVLFGLYGVGWTTKIISHSPEQAHLLFPIDWNCKLQGTDLIGKYKDVLVVVKLSWSYLDFGPYGVGLFTRIIIPNPEKVNMLQPIDSNCKLQ